MKYEAMLKWFTFLFFGAIIASCLFIRTNTAKEPLDFIDNDVFKEKINKQLAYLKSVQNKLDLVKKTVE